MEEEQQEEEEAEDVSRWWRRDDPVVDDDSGHILAGTKRSSTGISEDVFTGLKTSSTKMS